MKPDLILVWVTSIPMKTLLCIKITGTKDTMVSSIRKVSIMDTNTMRPEEKPMVKIGT